MYDEANAERIRAAGPAILDGFGEDDATEESLLELARGGALVVYELQQDDSRDVLVRIRGDGEDDPEPSEGYLAPRLARLSLPSGRLCIEGYDSLRLSDEWRFQAEQHRSRYGTEYEYTGAVTDVAPGEYVLGIRQRDVTRDAAGNEDLPTDIFTLSPAGSAPPFDVDEGIFLIR